MKLDFKEIADGLLSKAMYVLPIWLPGGKLMGREYSCADLRGGPGQSLKVNVESGLWKDFATGEAGGDLISLYAAIRGVSQVQAARDLASRPSNKNVSATVSNGGVP